MDFFLIMGIGTVVAIWVVANLPKSGGAIHADDWPQPDAKPPQTPAWRKDRPDVFATDDLDYGISQQHLHIQCPRRPLPAANLPKLL